MKNHFCNRKYTSCDAHSAPFNKRNNSSHMKYINVTRKTFCDSKNTAFDKRSIIYVTEEIFPLKERIYLVIGNLFPVTGIKKNPSCHRALFLGKKEYFLSQEEQRTPRVTGIIFQCAGNIFSVSVTG